MDFSVIVTLGPSVLDPVRLKQINELGPCLFRINGAHESPDGAEAIVRQVRAIMPEAVLLLDLPGNKIRTAGLSTPIRLVKGERLTLYPFQVNFPPLARYLKRGDEVFANDSTYRLEVTEIRGDAIEMLSHSDGLLGNNKGLHVRGIHHDLPFLFERDQQLIDRGCDLRLDYISLSFVRTADDVREAKRRVADRGKGNVRLIAKIETAAAVKNLGAIMAEVDTINVDRGDLSSDIGLLNLPVTQERIIESALRAKRRIFLATQFLKNMEVFPVPLIAELTSLHESIRKGIHGIQLSEETAVGKYPAECVRLAFDVFQSSFSG